MDKMRGSYNLNSKYCVQVGWLSFQHSNLDHMKYFSLFQYKLFKIIHGTRFQCVTSSGTYYNPMDDSLDAIGLGLFSMAVWLAMALI